MRGRRLQEEAKWLFIYVFGNACWGSHCPLLRQAILARQLHQHVRYQHVDQQTETAARYYTQSLHVSAVCRLHDGDLPLLFVQGKQVATGSSTVRVPCGDLVSKYNGHISEWGQHLPGWVSFGSRSEVVPYLRSRQESAT